MVLTSKVKQSLTTGEVSKMLGMPLSIVERFFEEGILAGWENPTTGMILIDQGSVNAFKRKWNAT
jgi:hypothetical protein